VNRRISGLPLAKAVRGFLLYKSAEAISPTTLRSYQDHLKLWSNYSGAAAVERILPADLSACLAWLGQEHQPRRITSNNSPLAPKSLRNYWVSLSAFFTWAVSPDFPASDIPVCPTVPDRRQLNPSTRPYPFWPLRRSRDIDLEKGP